MARDSNRHVRRNAARNARQPLRDSGIRFTYMQADAQAIPFRDESFDAVIANHMLYHVPDIPRALGEVKRVLKPSGFCYAATMGRANMKEMDEFAARFFSIPRMTESTERFGLESGEAYMRAAFSEVKLDRYPDSLVITEAAPLMDYINSMRMRRRITDDQIAALRAVPRERNRDPRRNPHDQGLRPVHRAPLVSTESTG